jgi:hypothetical protein
VRGRRGAADGELSSGRSVLSVPSVATKVLLFVLRPRSAAACR